VPAIADSTTRGAVEETEVVLPRELTGRSFTIRIDAVREVTSPDYFSGQPNLLPVGVAEVELPGVETAAPPATVPANCRDDLVTVDGEPVAVRLVGESADAAARRPITLEACAPLALGAGGHVVRSAIGRDLGIDVDQLVLRSGEDAVAPAAPEVTVLDSGATEMRLEVAPSSSESWLVLGQSHSDGWRATVGGDDLGRPLLANGFANAWRLPAHTEPVEVSLRWTPQRVVDAALIASLVGVAGVLVLARPRRDDGRPLPSPPTVHAPGRRWEVITVVLVAIFAGILPALLAAAAAEIARRRPGWRDRLLIVPVALLGTVAAIIAYKQVRYDLPATLDWPQAFPWTHGLTWAAVAVAAGVASACPGRAETPQQATRATVSSASGGGA
jgi:arabinofuranan 3-O-arabinosyltransferase